MPVSTQSKQTVHVPIFPSLKNIYALSDNAPSKSYIDGRYHKITSIISDISYAHGILAVSESSFTPDNILIYNLNSENKIVFPTEIYKFKNRFKATHYITHLKIVNKSTLCIYAIKEISDSANGIDELYLLNIKKGQLLRDRNSKRYKECKAEYVENGFPQPNNVPVTQYNSIHYKLLMKQEDKMFNDYEKLKDRINDERLKRIMTDQARAGGGMLTNEYGLLCYCEEAVIAGGELSICKSTTLYIISLATGLPVFRTTINDIISVFYKIYYVSDDEFIIISELPYGYKSGGFIYRFKMKL